jgi:hypothetical protein
MRDTVKDRVSDAALTDPFSAELKSLATTGMETAFIKKFLRAAPPPEVWEIGEALAECVVSQDNTREICWPWNTVRDRRTPRASLPGADLVGFCRENDAVYLLIGEVKTSSDVNTPPQVMYGDGGMTWQLEQNATRLDIQHTLLKWLRSRCASPEHIACYRAAVKRYIRSSGKDFLLMGILIRDTTPSELDVKSRALHLADLLPAPTRIELTAWYLPVPIAEWTALIHEEES